MRNFILPLIFFLLSLAVFAGFDMPRCIRADRQARLDARIKRERIIGRRLGKIEKYRNRQRQLMKVTGIPFAVFILLTVIALAFGFVLGKMMFSDVFLACAMSTAFLVVPSLYLEMENNKRRNYDAERLENAMSIVTNSYISTGNIVQAIESSLPALEYRRPFEEFCEELHFLSSNVETALLHMGRAVKNNFFLQWVDTLVLAQTDRIQIQALPAIIAQMNEQRKAQIEADTSMVAIWQEYIIMLVMVCTIPLLFRVAMYRGYEILVTTFIGRLLMLCIIASMLHSLRRAVVLNHPIKAV